MTMSGEVTQVHLRIPTELHQALTAIAKKERRTLSGVITIALEHYAESQQPVPRSKSPNKRPQP